MSSVARPAGGFPSKRISRDTIERDDAAEPRRDIANLEQLALRIDPPRISCRPCRLNLVESSWGYSQLDPSLQRRVGIISGRGAGFEGYHGQHQCQC